MDKRAQVLEVLGDWVIYVANSKSLATSGEVEALPKVAEVFFNNYSFGPLKKSNDIADLLEDISKSNVRSNPATHKIIPLSNE